MPAAWAAAGRLEDDGRTAGGTGHLVADGWGRGGGGHQAQGGSRGRDKTSGDAGQTGEGRQRPHGSSSADRRERTLRARAGRGSGPPSVPVRMLRRDPAVEQTCGSKFPSRAGPMWLLAGQTSTCQRYTRIDAWKPLTTLRGRRQRGVHRQLRRALPTRQVHRQLRRAPGNASGTREPGGSTRNSAPDRRGFMIMRHQVVFRPRNEPVLRLLIMVARLARQSARAGGRHLRVSFCSSSYEPLKKFWSNGVSVNCQKVCFFHPPGAWPGAGL